MDKLCAGDVAIVNKVLSGRCPPGSSFVIGSGSCLEYDGKNSVPSVPRRSLMRRASWRRATKTSEPQKTGAYVSVSRSRSVWLYLLFSAPC